MRFRRPALASRHIVLRFPERILYAFCAGLRFPRFSAWRLLLCAFNARILNRAYSADRLTHSPLSLESDRKMGSTDTAQLRERVKSEVPSIAKVTLTGVHHGGKIPAEQVQKGSAGLGLPEKLTPETVKIIQETAPVVWQPGNQAFENTDAFYKKLLWGDSTPSWESKATGKYAQIPELNLWSIFSRTNQLNGAQISALAASVSAYVHNIGDPSPLLIPGGAVEMIAHKHCALHIRPEHYPMVHDNLLATMKEVYGEAVTPPIGAAWSEAVLFLAKVLIDLEEKLYKEVEGRAGGWRGLKTFTVAAIEDQATGVKTFTFKDPQYSGGYDFTVGQHISVKVDADGDGLTCPRHYTVTSAPGDKVLQITVKKLPQGKVSSYLHDKVRVGDTVQLTAPFGIFSPPQGSKSAVLISAGIGVTPMVNFMRHYQKQGDIALIAHVDVDAAAHPFCAHFEKSGKLMTHYTNCRGRPVPGSPGDINLDDFVNKIVGMVGIEHDFFLCGPPEFMAPVRAAITAKGARCHSEAFGPQLNPHATGTCPMTGKCAMTGQCPMSNMS